MSRHFLGPGWSHGNPVNIGSDASAKRYGDALDLLRQDPTNDAVLVLNYPASTSDGVACAQAVIEASRRPCSGRARPVLTSWLGEWSSDTPVSVPKLSQASRREPYFHLALNALVPQMS